MRLHHLGLAVAFGLVANAQPGWADDPKPQDGIVGSGVMGDKGRSGPDGWSWAPVTRDQGAGSKGPGQEASAAGKTPNAQPDRGAGKTLKPGDDPGTPMVTDARGPGSMDAKGSARQP